MKWIRKLQSFGKNIIPSMLEHKERLYAYRFDGYWKDVGTIDSLWEANMDLLNPNLHLTCTTHHGRYIQEIQ